tara:strand:- start:2792 stop:3016 length:225 start_codon:yes stop_codon:yes gene_type:complete
MEGISSVSERRAKRLAPLRENLPELSAIATDTFSPVLYLSTPLGVLIGLRYGEAHSVERLRWAIGWSFFLLMPR